ncbi:MAG: leucyl aminopeptidase family protein [Phycisphaeraceae bacterium]|nr:leucyl aminopeptidase family protein [Phycisphaeraceae bacterium]
MLKSVRVGAEGGARPAALVVGVFQGEKGPSGLDAGAKKLDTAGAIAAACKRGECTGAPGSVVECFPAGGAPAARVLVLGLGKKDGFDHHALHKAVQQAAKRLASAKEKDARFELDGALAAGKIDAERAGQSIGEAFGLLTFDTNQFKGSATPKSQWPTITLRPSKSAPAASIRRGLALAESVNNARRWGFTPPNIATPNWMAGEAQKLARGIDTLSVRVVRGAELVKEKMEGHLNVGKASENPPCLIRIEYKPKKAKAGARPVVLLGKTITYDTGGLSLKPTNFMAGMKGDMCGGANTLGAMHAIATVIKPNFPVVGLLVAAENSVSEDAYRPDDVLTFRNGVTVEVTNTDAEGRLVLADGLCWAEAKEKPACIIDMATLTGGVITALGSTFAGMWCEDDKLRGKIESAAKVTGDRVWRLPHDESYREMMKSPCADIVNSNPNRKAHPIQGAAFLSYFVSDKTPWCHLDIAGVSDAETEMGTIAKDTPTGWGVRLLAEYIGSL